MRLARWMLGLALGAGLALPVAASEVCRWKDAAGQTHFADCATAPAGVAPVAPRKPAPVAVVPALPAAVGSSDINPPAVSGPVTPALASTSRPVDAARVPPGCRDLIGQIARVKPGVPWQDLLAQFNGLCPGIAYECKQYRSKPENNRCQWVERTGSNVLQTHRFE